MLGCNSLIPLLVSVRRPNVFLLSVESYSAIFKNIAQALYEQKRPCIAERNVYMGKKGPTKARSWVYESGIPIRQGDLFPYKQILILQ